MGGIYPYGKYDSLEIAQKCGFRDLNYYNEWQRNGISELDSYTQIDSIVYLAHHWCKYVKFGFQRVADMACKFVRKGHLTREQAAKLIDKNDYKLDGAAKRDMCHTIGITEELFDEVVKKHTNKNLVEKENGRIYNYSKGICPIVENLHFNTLIAHEYMRPGMSQKRFG